MSKGPSCVLFPVPGVLVAHVLFDAVRVVQPDELRAGWRFEMVRYAQAVARFHLTVGRQSRSGVSEVPTTVVVDYDPDWPVAFERLRAHVWPAVHDLAVAIEHVGSTSVPGLAAKPIVDMSIVVPSDVEVPMVIERLATLGYVHMGNLGIGGREAFKNNPSGLPAHHLYLSPQGSLGLENPLAVRDYLRTHPETAQAYGDLKKKLASQFPHDIDSYIDGKTDLILGILQQQGFSSERLAVIERANRKT